MRSSAVGTLPLKKPHTQAAPAAAAIRTKPAAPLSPQDKAKTRLTPSPSSTAGGPRASKLSSPRGGPASADGGAAGVPAPGPSRSGPPPAAPLVRGEGPVIELCRDEAEVAIWGKGEAGRTPSCDGQGTGAPPPLHVGPAELDELTGVEEVGRGVVLCGVANGLYAAAANRGTRRT